MPIIDFTKFTPPSLGEREKPTPLPEGWYEVRLVNAKINQSERILQNHGPGAGMAFLSFETVDGQKADVGIFFNVAKTDNIGFKNIIKICRANGTALEFNGGYLPPNDPADMVSDQLFYIRLKIEEYNDELQNKLANAMSTGKYVAWREKESEALAVPHDQVDVDIPF